MNNSKTGELLKIVFVIMMILSFTTIALAAIDTTLLNGNFTSDNSKSFNMGKDQVVKATIDCIKDSGISIQSLKTEENLITIIGSKGVTATSWGANIGILIKPVDEKNTIVKVVYKGKWGHSKNWASYILNDVAARLLQENSNLQVSDVNASN